MLVFVDCNDNIFFVSFLTPRHFYIHEFDKSKVFELFLQIEIINKPNWHQT